MKQRIFENITLIFKIIVGILTLAVICWSFTVLSAPYHKLSIAIVALIIMIMLCLLLFSQRKSPFNSDLKHEELSTKSEAMPNAEIKDDPSEESKNMPNIPRHEQKQFVFDLIEAWKSFFIIALVAHYTLNILSIYCSIINTYIASTYPNDTSSIVLYSVLAITFLFVDMLVHPKEISIGYRKAYEDGSAALNNYLNSLEGADWTEVLKTIAAAEKNIGQHLF